MTATGVVSGGIATALGSGFADVQADVLTIVTTGLPYALAILGVGLALRIGVKIFKSISGK